MNFKHYSANTVIEEQNRYFLDDIDAGKLNSISATGFVLPYSCSISFNETLRVFSIIPQSSFIFYYKGIEFTKTTTEQIQIPNTTSIYYISYNSSGVLQLSTTFYDLENCVPISYLYWNSTTSKAIIFADERHTTQMSIMTHENLHMTRGCVYSFGLSLNNYSTSGLGNLDSNCQFSISDGVIYDEDIKISITHSNTPTLNTWEQILQPVCNLPIWYKDSSGWNKTNNSVLPIKFGTQTAQYNYFDGTNWVLQDVSNTFYFSMWLVASNGLNNPIFILMGQQQYNKLSDAQNNDTFSSLSLNGFPVAEFRPLYRLIYQTSTSFTNSVKSRLVSVSDIRMVASSISGITASDHGILSGLGDDDHLQYVHKDISRTITAQHIFSPSVVQPAFVINGNAQNQLIQGLNADLLDGYNSSSFELISNKGIANGYASLDSSGKISSNQLPSYVDDVLEFSNIASFPTTGENGKIYIDLSTNKVYRWSGSQYIYITSGAVDSVNGYTGVVVLSKSDVGLGNVTNESKTTMFTNPQFTGTPTAPTATNGNSTTQIATTNFVQNSIQMVGNTDTKVFSYNSNVLLTNTTIPSGTNASAIGPVSISDGIVVSVSEGSRLVIL